MAGHLAMEAEQLGRAIATSSGPLATAVINSPPALWTAAASTWGAQW
jgi:hypothetical protein